MPAAFLLFAPSPQPSGVEFRAKVPPKFPDSEACRHRMLCTCENVLVNNVWVGEEIIMETKCLELNNNNLVHINSCGSAND